MKTSISIFQSYFMQMRNHGIIRQLPYWSHVHLDVSIPKTSIQKSLIYCPHYTIYIVTLNFINISFSTTKVGFFIKIQKSLNQRQIKSRLPAQHYNEDSVLPKWQTHVSNYKKDVYKSSAEACFTFCLLM